MASKLRICLDSFKRPLPSLCVWYLHWVQDNPQNSFRSPPPNSQNDKTDRCFNCHQEGHWAQECPEIYQENSLGRPVVPQPQSSYKLGLTTALKTNNTAKLGLQEPITEDIPKTIEQQLDPTYETTPMNDDSYDHTKNPFPVGISYSRTYPVRVHLQGSDKPPIIGLAIMDNQASISCVHPTVLKYFDVDNSKYDNVSCDLSTITNPREKCSTKCVTGLSIQPLADPSEDTIQKENLP